MKICFTSDTHNLHRKIDIPPCDILIHCGDFTNFGKESELTEFNSWVRGLKLLKRIKKCFVVPGNHDITLEKEAYTKDYIKSFSYVYLNAVQCLPDIDGIWSSTHQEIDGINFVGFSYVLPCGVGWSFQQNEMEIYDRLQKLPKKPIDVFVSHSPPFGILDENYYNMRCGSQSILGFIRRRQPRYHFFGHLHENAGVVRHEGATICCNVASGNPTKMKEPIILEIFPKT